MRVLIIKTSSLGDVIHTLPALTDAGKAIPDIRFDWVVEEGFQEVPRWHPLVDNVIPVAIRRWRKTFFKSLFNPEVKIFWKKLRAKKYDRVIDAQGLIKSGILTYFSRGLRVGLNQKSLTESLARFAYQKTVDVDLQGHAVMRMRSIFAQALGYDLPQVNAEYHLSKDAFKNDAWNGGDYLIFLHGTTWPTKHWPNNYWLALAKLAEAEGYKIRMPWGNETERKRVEELAKQCDAIKIIPRSNLTGVASAIAGAKAVVAVDTGLGHLTAALDVPAISLYGPTDPKRIGTIGQDQLHLAPDFECLACDHEYCTYKQSKGESAICFERLKPEMVWEKLKKLLNIGK